MSFIEENKERVNGLRLLAANPNYDLEFYDESVREPIDSRNANYIKKISEKIYRASITVCLISDKIHNSAWFDWELEESDKKGNTIIAMALKGAEKAILPKRKREKNLVFHGWDPGQLIKLVGEV